MKCAPPGASMTPSTMVRLIFMVWREPSFWKSSVAMIRSHDMNRRFAAMQ